MICKFRIFVIQTEVYVRVFSLSLFCIFAVVSNVSDEEMQEHYDNFFEDVFVECEDKVSHIFSRIVTLKITNKLVNLSQYVDSTAKLKK